MMDVATTLAAITVGLKFIEQFRNLILRYKKQPIKPPTATAEQTENAIIIKHHDQVVAEVKAEDLKLNQWDSVRYYALRRPVEINWELFHELLGQMPLLSADEKGSIKMRMETIRKELCEDFIQMRDIYEQAMGVPLAEHFPLYEICG